MEVKIKKDGQEKKRDVFLGIIAVVLSAYILPLLKIPVISPFLPFIFAVFVGHYFLRYTLSEYTYYFGEKILKIDHKTGYRSTTLLEIPINSVNYVKPTKEKAKNLTVGILDNAGPSAQHARHRADDERQNRDGDRNSDAVFG